MKKIRFYLLGHKGLYVLQSLNKDELQIISDVVIAKDKAVINDYSLEIEQFCKKKSITFYHKNSEPITQSDYAIAIGWRWLINFSNNLIVIHDSLLPKLRGFNPLVTALINGDNKIGATALLANKEFDKGPIIYQNSVEIKYPIKIETAIDLISNVYAEIIEKIIAKIKTNTLTYKEQIEENATYSLWRDEDDYQINWNWGASKIKRFIDSVGFPYKGAKTKVNNMELRIFDAELVKDLNIENRTPGKVLFKDNDGLTIVCGKGLLKIKDFYTNENTTFDYTKLFRLRFQ